MTLYKTKFPQERSYQDGALTVTSEEELLVDSEGSAHVHITSNLSFRLGTVEQIKKKASCRNVNYYLHSSVSDKKGVAC